MLLSDFDYHLPEELIAQHPLEVRSSSRLMFLQRQSSSWSHHQFSDLASLLCRGDLVVRNVTKVLPARLLGKKDTGGQVELLLLRQIDNTRNIWNCLSRSSKPLSQGVRLKFPFGILGEVLDVDDRGQRQVRFDCEKPFIELLQLAGQIPLPPYIRRAAEAGDVERYQTVFASNPGAVAAPTAGLHFTQETFATLRNHQVEVCDITLHVGAGTFLPVREENILQHQMHSEVYEIPEASAKKINDAKREGRRIVALGTTVVRTLEHAVNDRGGVVAGKGETQLFLMPGDSFRIVDVLLTNFHLPKSTLLILVSAFAGKEFILKAYEEAIRRKYRFFSYGDCMLID